MPRSIWNGTIAFAQVAVPVKLYSATESKTVHFNELHEKDKARIEHRRFCSKEDKEVPWEEVVKGYEVRGGKYVVLTKEEVAAADPGGKTIELEDFVQAEEIDPVVYDRTYYVGAQKGGEDGYRLLLEALKKAERVGIGRFVFHNKEQLVALRPLDGLLGLHTMRFADELVDAKDLDIAKPQKQPGKREVDMASKLVDTLEKPFKPQSYKDTYRARVEKLIKDKAAGKEIERPEPEETEAPDDLMAALEASLG
jgi:DNA end-binding protein Ku